MGNNPIYQADPSGDIPFFIIPQFGVGNGGISIGLEIGIGFPGALSLSITGGVNMGSNVSGYWSVQGSVAGFYGGYGSQGWFGGYGLKYSGFSAGISYGQNAGWGVGLNYGTMSGNYSSIIGLGWTQNGGFNFGLTGAYLYFPGLIQFNNLESSLQNGTWNVDPECEEIGLNPFETAPIERESVNKVETLKSIKFLISLVKRKPVWDFTDQGYSEYTKEGIILIDKSEFSSWRRLATAYGHELVHRHFDWNLKQKILNKGFYPSRSYDEYLAHSWSTGYSGIKSVNMDKYKMESTFLRNKFDNQFLIKP